MISPLFRQYIALTVSTLMVSSASGPIKLILLRVFVQYVTSPFVSIIESVTEIEYVPALNSLKEPSSEFKLIDPSELTMLYV